MNFIFQPDVPRLVAVDGDGTGYIYHKRVNDLIIHTSAVYAFLPPSEIHRFLDFTYQHFANYKACSKCPLMWCAIAGGYADESTRSRRSCDTIMRLRDCRQAVSSTRRKETLLPARDEYNTCAGLIANLYHHHLTDNTSITLPEVAAGHCDLQNVGVRSG
jgi:hypothetical protein